MAGRCEMANAAWLRASIDATAVVGTNPEQIPFAFKVSCD